MKVIWDGVFGEEEGSMKWDAILNKMKLVERIITIMIHWLVLLFGLGGVMIVCVSEMRVQGDFGVWCRRLNENVTRGGIKGGHVEAAQSLMCWHFDWNLALRPPWLPRSERNLIWYSD